MIFSPRYCLFLTMLDPENRIFKCNWMVGTFSTQAMFQDINQSKNIGHFYCYLLSPLLDTENLWPISPICEQFCHACTVSEHKTIDHGLSSMTAACVYLLLLDEVRGFSGWSCSPIRTDFHLIVQHHHHPPTPSIK